MVRAAPAAQLQGGVVTIDITLLLGCAMHMPWQSSLGRGNNVGRDAESGWDMMYSRGQREASGPGTRGQGKE